MNWFGFPVDCAVQVLEFCTWEDCVRLTATSQGRVLWSGEVRSRMVRIARLRAVFDHMARVGSVRRIRMVTPRCMWQPSDKFALHLVEAPRRCGRSVWLCHRIAAWSEWYPLVLTSLNVFDEPPFDWNQLPVSVPLQVPVDTRRPDLIPNLKQVLRRALPDGRRALWIIDDTIVKREELVHLTSQLERCDVVYIVNTLRRPPPLLNPATVTCCRAVRLHSSMSTTAWYAITEVTSHIYPKPFEFYTIRKGDRPSRWTMCSEIAPESFVKHVDNRHMIIESELMGDADLEEN